jgi:hypothetical protein
MAKLRLWKVEYEEHWTCSEHGAWEENGHRWSVAAPTMADAIKKTQPLALAQTAVINGDDGKPGKTVWCVEARPVYAEAISDIDA